MNVLGIESSCDETSVAIVSNEQLVANLIYSQVEHCKYGGVVPEVASRAHLEKIDRLTDAALKQAGMSINDINLIAVTDRPGLAGALLVGVSFALGLHTACSIPITGIHHLEGHIYSAVLEYGNQISYPFLALVVSGGHTALYRVEELGTYILLGETVDDAAGEAFDKVGKLLGFAYPAGRAIEMEAAKCTTMADIPLFPVARCSQGELFFSFSGLKTAVKNYIAKKDAASIEAERPAICAGFQQAVTNSLVSKACKASEHTGINSIVLVGGVACNSFLRNSLKKAFKGEVFAPRPGLCTDNAGMIALAGYHRSINNKLQFPKMNPSVPLGEKR